MGASSTTARRAAKAAVRALSAGALRLAGTDATAVFEAGACVVVAPHPDDETFGCGATIARMAAAGTDVRVVFVSGGGASPAPPGMTRAGVVEMRRAEARDALAELGVSGAAAVHLDFDDGRLGEQVDDIRGALEQVLAARRAARVLVTSARDRHPDHRAVALATRAAVTAAPGHPELFEYPIWQRAPGLTAAWAGERPRLVRAGTFLGHKRRAVGAYASQLPHLPAGFVGDFLVAYESFTPVRL